jgi:hypothetical protein
MVRNSWGRMFPVTGLGPLVVTMDVLDGISLLRNGIEWKPVQRRERD